jgi:ferredoxin
MPTIELLPRPTSPALGTSPAGPAVRVVSAGPLVDVCDEAHAPIELSCRAANCGICRVDVLAGAELMEPAGADERAVLERFAAAPGQRLACQAVVRAGPGLLRLRWAGA